MADRTDGLLHGGAPAPGGAGTSLSPERMQPRVRGRPVGLDDAAAAAAELLLAARLPLIYGLIESTVEAQRRAVELADLVGGAVDTAASAGHAAAVYGFERVGHLGATLGELRTRADLVVYWGIDPEERHPGFHARYAAPAPGAPPRAVVAVDLDGARGPAEAEERLALPAAREVEALWALQALLRGRRLEPARVEAAGLPLDGLRRLAGRLRGSRYAVVVYDGDPPPERRGPLRGVALAALAEAAGPAARVRLLAVRLPGNPVGAEAVLAWQTGYPCAVHFGAGHPRYGPEEFSGEALLARGDADAALVVGADPARHLSAAARRRLAEIPVAVVGPADGRLDGAAVQVPTAPAEATPGGVYRFDGVPLRRRVRPPAAPTEADVLARIVEAVRARGAGGGR